MPRFGKTQRVISFTRLDQPEHDLDAIIEEARGVQADVIKFTWPTPTIDDAWPLLKAVSASTKGTLPIVGLGLGRGDLTFSLLSVKYGSPWLYAALENGMEAYPDQPTVFELEEIYHLKDIDRSTAFIAVTGFGDSQPGIVRALNTAFQSQGVNARCLPLFPGDISRLSKMLDALKIRAILASGGYAKHLAALADHMDPRDKECGSVDLLLHKSDGWHGSNSIWKAGVQVLGDAVKNTGHGLGQRSILVLGNGGTASAMAYGLAQFKGLVSVCGPNDKKAQATATKLGCRYIPFQNLYDTLFDIVVITDPAMKVGAAHGNVNAALLHEHMTVLDVSDPPKPHELAEEAKLRGCTVVDSSQLFRDRLAVQYRAIVGKDLPEESARESGGGRRIGCGLRQAEGLRRSGESHSCRTQENDCGVCFHRVIRDGGGFGNTPTTDRGSWSARCRLTSGGRWGILPPGFTAAGMLLTISFVLLNASTLGSPGLRVFNWLTWCDALVISASAVIFFAPVIGTERETGSLTLLRMTGTSPLTLVVGHSLSGIVIGCLLIAVQLPFTVLTITLGGVLWDQVLAGFLALPGAT